jgi:hypothetical protein
MRTIEVTVFFDPTEVMVESSHGMKLTFREWCEREVTRINETATERPAEIDRREDGFIRIIRR